MKIVDINSGLGNQMFQYALYIFLKNNYKNVYVNLEFFEKNYLHNGYELEKIFNIKFKNKKDIKFLHSNNIFFKILKKILLLNGIIFDDYKELEKNLQIEDIKKKIESKYKIIYRGCWQSEKYFLKFEKEIREIFKFPEIIDKKNLKVKDKILKENSVSIHIRRGDYLVCDLLKNLLPLFYYEAAIKYILEKVESPIFFIFSNDIEWCKNNLKINFPTYYIDWNKGKESFRDMQLMSLCKYNIIANSSFSWWGAWLNSNSNKIVIAPEKWINDEEKYYKEIIPDSWIKIKNY